MTQLDMMYVAGNIRRNRMKASGSFHNGMKLTSRYKSRKTQTLSENTTNFLVNKRPPNEPLF